MSVIPQEIAPAKPTRLLSLDVFRGMAVLLMMLVNHIGRAPGVPDILHHAYWAGDVHLADLAYPWFLFAMGIAIPFSVASFRKMGQPMWRYDIRILRRATLLILFGFLLTSLNSGHLDLGFGVLQLLGIDFAIVTFLYDLPFHRRAILAGILLLLYWAAIRYIPIPGMGAGVFNEERNIVDYINKTFLAPVGLWGLTQIVPTLALVFIGTLVGDLLHLPTYPAKRKVFWLIVGGAALIGLGVAWSLSLPFNKPVWTPPFILFAGGTGIVSFGLLYFILDIKFWRQWSWPMAVFGSNALLAYILSVGVNDALLSPLGVSTAGWLRVSIYIGFWWLICWLLYLKKWFLRV